MYLNDFSVRIPEGVEQPGGYVELDHDQQYRLVMRNRGRTRCDARVEIDGKHVGTWRIATRGSITIERPAHDQGRFTFYQVGTEEAYSAGLHEGNPNLGLVRVTFTPEIARVRRRTFSGLKARITTGHSSRGATYSLCSADVSGGVASCYHSAGGTGLSGHSHQAFVRAPDIDPDYSRQTVIHLRLVCRGREDGPRPLTAFSTPVPPPV